MSTIILNPFEIFGAWSPLDLGENLVLWFEGSTIGTDGSVVDGSNLLGQWFDKSTNTRHFIQSTTGEKPLWDGTNKVTFDGIDNLMTVPGSKGAGWLKDFHNGDKITDIAVKINIPIADPDAFYPILCTAALSTTVGFLTGFDDRSSLPKNDSLIHQVLTGSAGNLAISNQGSSDLFPVQNIQWARFTSDPSNVTPADRSTIYNESTSEANNAESTSPSAANAQLDLTIGQITTFFSNIEVYEIIVSDRQFTLQEWNFIKQR